jgi:hypothetical protein
MWLRFAVHAPVGYIDDFQAYYRYHSENMHIAGDTHNNGYRIIRDYRQQEEAFRILLDNYGQRLEGTEELRSLVRCRLAEEAFWEAYRAFDVNEVKKSQDYLRYAVEMNPDIVSWPSYSRLRLKHVMGSAIWAFIRPLWNRLDRRTMRAYTNDDRDLSGTK